MKAKQLFVVPVLLVEMVFSKLFEFESTLHPNLLNHDQLFINRKERFIKFDTKDNELEIDLGISIPFVKVPLMTGRQFSPKEETNIRVNAPGAIVAGMLMLTSFIIIPLLFTNKTILRKSVRAEANDIWSVLKSLDNQLHENGIESTSCIQKSICWLTTTSKKGNNGSLGAWIDYLINTWWFKRLTEDTFLGDAIKESIHEQVCETKYNKCGLTSQYIFSFLGRMKGAQSTLKS